MQSENLIRLSATVAARINFAMQHNHVPVIQAVVIDNSGDLDLERVQLSITSEPPLTQPFTRFLERIPAHETVAVESIPLRLKAAELAALTERTTVSLRVVLAKGDEVLAETEIAAEMLSYDEWPGIEVLPELLAAFVTPNHPEVARLCAAASGLLGKWTGSPSLDGYQCQDPNRVKQQFAAVYGALQAENFVYSIPPASFEQSGQRIRMCDTMMQQHMGTCLDLTLLYASCLESMGLHPLVVVIDGHAFAGVWLEDVCFPEIVQDDAAALTKRIAAGIETIALVECTMLVAGKNVDFSVAEGMARHHLADASKFRAVVDISRARAGGIRPLPQRVMTPEGWTVLQTERDASELTDAPVESVVQTALDDNETAGPMTRRMQWERKLLDLSLRNTLLNLRLTRGVIPVLTDNLGALEDALSGAEDFQVLARPSDWPPFQRGEAMFELGKGLGLHGGLLPLEFKNHRLRTPLDPAELSTALTGLYRAARLAQEENGANTLYLAMGLLKWYESPASQRARYAPLVLLPVDILRRSVQKGFVIRLRDDEPQMNVTLLEMLKQDFGLVIGGLDPLPADEKGVDLRRVFSTMRQGILQQQRWDIVESAFLGIFSFSQFVMWNDIRNRADDLAKNKIVSSLIEGKLTWLPDPVEDGESLEAGVMAPIPADASQLRAIKAAGEGKSFVLHGPPGTGKSQTITNIIANALAQGRSVLFVAEKMAALSVVERRLQGIGIDPFCLELHSNKSRKRDVLDQLKEATEVTRDVGRLEYEERANRLGAIREELQVYVTALHAVRECGMSLYDLISLYEDRSNALVIMIPIETTASLDAAGMENWREQVSRLVAAGRDCGHPSGHPLEAVRQTVYTQELRMQAPGALAVWGAAVDRLAHARAAACERMGLTRPAASAAAYADVAGLERLAEGCSALLGLRDVPEVWLRTTGDLAGLVRDVQTLVAHGRPASEAWRKLDGRWKEEFFSLDGEALARQWEMLSAKWFLPKALGMGKIAKTLGAYVLDNAGSEGAKHGRISKAELGQAVLALREYQRESQAMTGAADVRAAELAGLYVGVQTDWNRLEQLCATALSGDQRLTAAFPGNGEAIRVRLVCAGIAQDDSVQQEYVSAWTDELSAYAAVDTLLSIDPDRLEAMDTDILAARRAAGTAWSGSLGHLREWVQWRAARGQANVLGLGSVVKAYEQGMEHQEIESAFERALAFSLILNVLRQEPELNQFSGAVFEERIARFRTLDREVENLARQEIFARLAARLPDFTREAAQSSELGILQRAIRSGGRGISVRRLFDMIPNLLPRLCPCMLMSPISAAQYLDPKRAPFDLVVFDEASQMPTCKAVGVLARGNDAVIVGDPKQMPPTSFFTTTNQDEENFETEDLESILDDCLALSMPNTHLLWHYRSRHESLIAFSNMQFYDNRLLTFPSPNDQISKVRLVEIGGYYDRGKTKQNRAEAEAIVSAIVRRLEGVETRKQSLGVVTFSAVQQNLVEDLLTEVFASRPDLEELAVQGDEPLFVKNLENVQGDERDIILFSVGYGPDEHGQVTLNFGPLNREGGWRRLNVAVSRARQEMVVYSTLRPDQINLTRTNALGVAGLKAFLEYAKSGTQIGTSEAFARMKIEKGGIGQQLCDALAAAGYTARRNVGRSGYRVDIGVADPTRPDQYLLGILLDGQNYRSALTTRDREFAQIEVLNGLGWRIHRVWTLDWWDNPEKEIVRLLAELVAAIEPAPACTAPVFTEPTKPTLIAGMAAIAEQDVTNRYVPATLIERQMTSEEFLMPNNQQPMLGKFREVLKAEAPIAEELLIRRVMQSYGIVRIGSRIQMRLTYVLKHLAAKTTEQNGAMIYWLPDQDPERYVGFRVGERDVRFLPVQEVANAVCEVVRQQFGLPREALLREAARLFEIMRMSSNVVTSMEQGLEYALAHGRVRIDGNGNVVAG